MVVEEAVSTQLILIFWTSRETHTNGFRGPRCKTSLLQTNLPTLSPHPAYPLSWGPQREHQWGWRLEDGWWVVILYSHWYGFGMLPEIVHHFPVPGRKNTFPNQPISTLHFLSQNRIKRRQKKPRFSWSKSTLVSFRFSSAIHWWWFPSWPVLAGPWETSPTPGSTDCVGALGRCGVV